MRAVVPEMVAFDENVLRFVAEPLGMLRRRGRGRKGWHLLMPDRPDLDVAVHDVGERAVAYGQAVDGGTSSKYHSGEPETGGCQQSKNVQ